MKVGERKSDVESELESEDPTDVDDMVFFEEEESREVVVTTAEHRDPTATSAGDEQEAARRVVVSAPRKRAASADAVGERAAKRTRSPRPLVASSVPSPPVADAAEQVRRSEERTGTCASPGPVTTRDSQPREAPPAADAVEQAGRSEEQTGARASRDSQPEDAPPPAPVGESRAEGHGDPQARQEPVGTTLSPAEVRGRGS